MNEKSINQFKTALANDILSDRKKILKMLSEKQKNGEIECCKNISKTLSNFACSNALDEAFFLNEFDKFFDVFVFNLYGRLLVADEKFKEVIQNIDLKSFDALEKDFEKIRPGTFEKIKTSYIDFEKFIQDLDDRAIQILLENTSLKVWFFALKGTDGKMIDKTIRNMSINEGKMFREDLKFGGPVLEKDVLSARWKIIEKAIALQNEGKIFLRKSHPFDDELNKRGVTDDAKNECKDKLVD